MATDLVVKSNRLNMALQNLTLAELRIIQLAIVDARETGTGLNTDTPLRIDASRYAEAFGTTRQNGYILMKQAEETLFNRRFSFTDTDGNVVKSRWIQQAKYLDSEGAIELVFTTAVVKGISRINGAEEFFTQYLLKQTASLNSVYSVRLYELLVQWKTAGKTPLFELSVFREQMGLAEGEYLRMGNFKSRVLDIAVDEVNDKTDLTVSYIQEKKGRIVAGFKFSIKVKEQPKDEKITLRDVNTTDMFTIEGLSDAQLARITRNPVFIADYNHLVSPQSSAGQGGEAWVSEMVKRLKLNPNQFNKKPIRSYLEY